MLSHVSPNVLCLSQKSEFPVGRISQNLSGSSVLSAAFYTPSSETYEVKSLCVCFCLKILKIECSRHKALGWFFFFLSFPLLKGESGKFQWDNNLDFILSDLGFKNFFIIQEQLVMNIHSPESLPQQGVFCRTKDPTGDWEQNSGLTLTTEMTKPEGSWVTSKGKQSSPDRKSVV